MRSQDIHFSQTDYLQVLTSPAYSGFFDGQGRFGLVYRNQWASVHNPFQTLAATVEVPVYQNKYHRYGLAIGGHILADKAGTLSYGTVSGNITLSFYKALNTRTDNLFSFAVSVGLNRTGFDPTDALMEDPSEQFAKEHVVYPVVGAGVAFYTQPSQSFTLKTGIAVYNINRPKLTYYNDGTSFLEPRLNLYVRAEWRFAEQWSLMPLAMIQFQRALGTPTSPTAHYTEILFGTDVKLYVDESSERNLAFQFGAAYRWADAAVFDLGIHYNAFSFFFLYDANISKLTPASRSIGAFEVGLVYHLNKKRNKRKALPCPII